MGKHERIGGRERVARRRLTLRAQGLRPRQFWVLDTRDPKVKAALRKEWEALENSPGYQEDLALAEAIQYWPPDDPD